MVVDEGLKAGPLGLEPLGEMPPVEMTLAGIPLVKLPPVEGIEEEAFMLLVGGGDEFEE